MEKVKVLYIAGWGRSGSTILSNVLGQADGFFSGGELRSMWRCATNDTICGCGSVLSACGVWTAVLSELKRRGWGSPARIADLSRRANSPANRLWSIAGSRIGCAASDEYLRANGDLYASVAAATGSRVVVDSTKLPGYAHTLRHVPGIELYVAHLVRDPRAVAHALTTRKSTRSGGGERYLPQARPAKTARGWMLRNLATGLLCSRVPGRSTLVRYEDFAVDPRGTVRRLMDLVGEEDTPNPVRPDGMVDIGVSHPVAGNPSRFRTGPVPIQLDDEWQWSLKPASRSTVALMTCGLLLRYGYPLHAGPVQFAGRRAPGWTRTA